MNFKGAKGLNFRGKALKPAFRPHTSCTGILFSFFLKFLEPYLSSIPQFFYRAMLISHR